LRRLSLITDILPGRYSTNDLSTRFILKKVEKLELSSKLDLVINYWCKFLQLYKSDYSRINREYKNILFIIDWCFSCERWKPGSTLLISIGNFLFKHGHWSELLNYCLNALNIAEENVDGDIIASLEIEHIGWIYYHLKNWNELLNHSRRGLELSQKNGNKKLHALALRNIGLFERENDLLIDSKGTFQQALSLLDEKEDEDCVSAVEGSYIVALTRLREFELAKSLILKELDRAKKVLDMERVAIATYRLAVLAHEDHDLIKAERILLECINIDHNLERFSSEAYTYERLSKVYEEMNSIQLAINAINHALDLFIQIGAGKSTIDQLRTKRDFLSKELE